MIPWKKIWKEFEKQTDKVYVEWDEQKKLIQKIAAKELLKLLKEKA